MSVDQQKQDLLYQKYKGSLLGAGNEGQTLMVNDQQKQDHRYHKYHDSLLGAGNEGQTDALHPEAGQVQCG